MIVPFGSMKKTTVTEFTRYEDEILGGNDELTRLLRRKLLAAMIRYSSNQLFKGWR